MACLGLLFLRFAILITVNASLNFSCCHWLLSCSENTATNDSFFAVIYHGLENIITSPLSLLLFRLNPKSLPSLQLICIFLKTGLSTGPSMQLRSNYGCNRKIASGTFKLYFCLVIPVQRSPFFWEH